MTRKPTAYEQAQAARYEQSIATMTLEDRATALVWHLIREGPRQWGDLLADVPELEHNYGTFAKAKDYARKRLPYVDPDTGERKIGLPLVAVGGTGPHPGGPFYSVNPADRETVAWIRSMLRHALTRLDTAVEVLNRAAAHRDANAAIPGFDLHLLNCATYVAASREALARVMGHMDEMAEALLPSA